MEREKWREGFSSTGGSWRRQQTELRAELNVDGLRPTMMYVSDKCKTDGEKLIAKTTTCRTVLRISQTGPPCTACCYINTSHKTTSSAAPCDISIQYHS